MFPSGLLTSSFNLAFQLPDVILVCLCCVRAYSDVSCNFFQQAVWNVGAIGAAIDMPNKATEALKKSLENASTSEDKKKVTTLKNS